MKYPPELIEQSLSEGLQADDTAVCSTTNADGIEELQIAVVNSRLDDAALASHVRSRISPNFLAIQLFRIDAIARDGSGKVQRQRLKQQLSGAQRVRLFADGRVATNR